jgi:hypothetical protein
MAGDAGSADRRREKVLLPVFAHHSCQSYFKFKAIDQMKRPEKSFSVEIK